MHSKFDFASDVAVVCCNVTDGQRRNLPNAQTTVNGQYKAKTITLNVTSRLDDTKDATDSDSFSTDACPMTRSFAE
jgi:hypothetical protein